MDSLWGSNALIISSVSGCCPALLARVRKTCQVCGVNALLISYWAKARPPIIDAGTLPLLTQISRQRE